MPIDRSERVYVIDSGEWSKIGVSTQPEKRRATVQSSTPLEARLVSVIRCKGADGLARRVESEFHSALSEYASPHSAEWFRLPDRESRALESLELITFRDTIPPVNEMLPSRLWEDMKTSSTRGEITARLDQALAAKSGSVGHDR